jgi:SAM-dependent methyltransferase
VTAQFHNRTRRSRSIPRSLVRRGRILDIPLYYVLRTSDLAREGLERSGSYEFADHIYRGQPSGRGPIGRWLDARLLQMPAARAFRFRYVAARREIASFLLERRTAPASAVADISTDKPLCARQQRTAVLSVPCGIPRELAGAASDVRTRLGSMPADIEFYGLDLDAVVLEKARRFMADNGILTFRTLEGDALDRTTYAGTFDFISCTGLTEFLDDQQVEALFRLLFDVLRPDGRLLTSGMQRRWTSDYLLTLGELRTHYRDAEQLRRLMAPLAFRDVVTETDSTGLQTVVIARR